MRLLIFVAMLAAAPAALNAQEGAQSFPSFTVLDRASGAVASTNLLAGQRTVLVVVRPACQSCERLLNTLAELPGVPGRAEITILVESSVDEAQRFVARKVPSALSAAPWFADARQEGWAALELSGTPVIMGIDASGIAWSYAGNPNRGLLDSLMRTWVGEGGVR
jgi:hypothetical protein